MGNQKDCGICKTLRCVDRTDAGRRFGILTIKASQGDGFREKRLYICESCLGKICIEHQISMRSMETEV
jgi:hypothetical protein